MWVRSQDKRVLIKCDCFVVSNKRIDAISNGVSYTTLGEYSTHEKTLKVLDKIQSEIIRTESIYAHEYSGSGVRDCDVFQMPQDEGVE